MIMKYYIILPSLNVVHFASTLALLLVSHTADLQRGVCGGLSSAHELGEDIRRVLIKQTGTPIDLNVPDPCLYFK